MPQTHPTASRPGLPPVPVAVLLPRPPHHRPSTTPTGQAPSTWCGLDAWNLAALICAYSQPGDVVLTIGPAPAVADLAEHLGRNPATLLSEDGRHRWLRASGNIRRILGQLGAGTILAALPDRYVDPADLAATTEVMHGWRSLLRPGGYLLVALTADGPPDGRVSPRSTVIAAARTAGLLWQQEFLAVLTPLPEHEPRAVPDTAAGTPAVLVEGRHQVPTSKCSPSPTPPEPPMPEQNQSTSVPGRTMPHPDRSGAVAPARQGSVFVTGQVCAREQRRDRYTQESLAHPGKMLPKPAWKAASWADAHPTDTNWPTSAHTPTPAKPSTANACTGSPSTRTPPRSSPESSPCSSPATGCSSSPRC
jgi:hypothetical protein